MGRGGGEIAWFSRIILSESYQCNDNCIFSTSFNWIKNFSGFIITIATKLTDQIFQSLPTKHWSYKKIVHVKLHIHAEWYFKQFDLNVRFLCQGYCHLIGHRSKKGVGGGNRGHRERDKTRRCLLGPCTILLGYIGKFRFLKCAKCMDRVLHF